MTTLAPFGTRFSLFEDLRREMDNLLTRFFAEESGDGTQVVAWAPRLNVSETDKEYEITVDLPGMKPEDIQVELRQGDLWISGERKTDYEEKGRTWHRIERAYGEFRRVVRLGDDVDPEKVEAEYKDGVLRITVQKKPTAQTKRIEIKR